MAQALGKAKMKALLKSMNCETEYTAWQKAQPLDDDGATRIDRLADEYEGMPRLRECDGYLFLDTGDGETIVVFKDTSGTRREIIRQILSAIPKPSPADKHGTGEDYSDETGVWEDVQDNDFMPDYEPNYEER